MPTLHPRLAQPAVIGELRARWASERRLRIEDALRPGLADALADRALAGPFEVFDKHVNDIQCVFFRRALAFADAEGSMDDDPIAAAHHLLRHDLPALVTTITGQELRAVEGDERVVFDLYRKGSYLDVHTDQGSERLIAWVVGLTRDRWPASEGGHLEFLAPDHHELVDRVAPGFGSLDLFCIFPLLRPHRIPVLQADVCRLSFNGWLTGEIKAPGEA